MVGDDTIGLPLISLIIQLGHLSHLKLYRLCNFESNYKQYNMKSISVILIGLFLDGCSSVHRVNGWYPVADVPENRIEGKAIVTVKDFYLIHNFNNKTYTRMNKILIAVASDSDCRLMSGLLTRAGYESVIAEDMEAAKQEVAKLSPGAVINSQPR